MIDHVYTNILLAGVSATAIAASITDWREQRIPNLLLLNSLIFAAIVFGCIAASGGGLASLRFPLLGMVLGGFFLFIPYRLHQVAAGDVKLAMVFGFYLGPIGIVVALLHGSIFGGVWALWIAWRQGGLRNTWRNLKLMGTTAYTSGMRELGWDLRQEGKLTMPYGVALSAGALSVVAIQLAFRYL